MTPKDTRETILRTALEAFGEQGYAGTSIRDLAARLDMTSAAMYYHFPSKSSLLEALVGPYLDGLEVLLERHPAAAGRRAKQALLADYLDYLLANERLADLVGRDPELDGHPDVGPRIGAAIEALVDRLAAPAVDDPVARLRATAAIGALRRPVLRPEIAAERLVDELLSAAMAALEG